MRKFAPPSTKYGPHGAAQPMAVPARAGHAPPPTKFSGAQPLQPKVTTAVNKPPAPRFGLPPTLQAMKGSGFNSTVSQSGQIYGIYFNPQFDTDGKITVNDTDTAQCIYVGKTIIKNVGDRFIQHVNEDSDMPWYIGNCSDGAYDNNDDDYWEYVPRELWKLKNVTPFDVAAAEHYYMQLTLRAGANLRNKVNALTARKYSSFKKKKNIFTTYKEYGSWEPENLKKDLDKLAKKRDDDGIF